MSLIIAAGSSNYIYCDQDDPQSESKTDGVSMVTSDSSQPPSETDELSIVTSNDDIQDNPAEEERDLTPHEMSQRTINRIIVEGNHHVPAQAILNRIPYHEGEQFNPEKTRQLINTLYFELKRFKNITVMVQPYGIDMLDLYIIVEEKNVLKDILIQGNKHLSEKEIKEKLKFADIPAVEEQELALFRKKIKKLYIDKGYFNAQIDARLDIDEEHRANLIFTVTENQKSLIVCIDFEGNEHISGKKLRNVIYTREDWILSFMDNSGTFIPDRLEADKHMIEQYYQNNGYLNAKVTDTKIDRDECSTSVKVTFVVQEGEKFCVSEVTASGNDILKDDFLAAQLPLKQGDTYSREKVVDSIKVLELIWGDLGYIYANIEPGISPNEDDNTVKISFFAELGEQVYLNKINIKGNRKTRDKVIRRQLVLEEGNILTNQRMELSKNRVESLGYFDVHDGVNWKITRVSKNLADLDLIVKETKTGNASVQLGFGGSPTNFQSPTGGLSLEAKITDTNLFGQGIRVNLLGRLSKEEKTLLFNLTDPWMFDEPILGAFDAYHKRLAYEEFNYTFPVNETQTGGSVTGGFVLGFRNPLWNDVYARGSVGLDSVSYYPAPLARTNNALANDQYNCVLSKLFQDGAFPWVNINVGQDRKNHPMHPNNGWSWLARFYSAFADFKECSTIGFAKCEFEYNYWTPLIGVYDLVFHLRAFMGIAHPFGNHTIPYREIFHIGGPASVRGFLFGQIGPQFVFEGRQDSIGGNKAMFVNAELIFPFTPDLSMKGLVFYDGGTGWDNPFAYCLSPIFLRNNSFSYRHSVGVGVRLLQPMPMRIDWGFKLDPRRGEPAYEVHFGMNYDW